MSLEDHQRAITRHALERDPTELDPSLPRERWKVYRSMIRGRIHDAVPHAFPSTRAALGTPRFESLVDAWLDAAPPRTRLFWELSVEFGAHLVSALETEGAWQSELAALERARWTRRHAPFPEPRPFSAFAFECVPVVNPSLTLLPVTRDVEAWRPEADEPPATELVLAVYRAADHSVGTHRLNALAGHILEGFARGDRTATECVKEAAAIRRARIDPAFVEATGTLLADFLERGILLGSRAD